MREPLLRLRGICKSFPGVLANDHVNLDVYAGEVHTLLGENGAGKSTLVKILYGFYRADAGEICLNGQPIRIGSPHDARRQRIGMVFQEFTLIPAMTVVENVALFLPGLPFVLDNRQLARKITETAERYHLQVDPWAVVGQLCVGDQQKVEVLKLLLADARVLILDEPTKVLAPHEVAGLFQVFERLKADGYAIVFITHKLREVLACADRITVVRRGQVAGELPRSQATEDGLVALMFGAALPEAVGRRAPVPSAAAPPLLELRGVDTRGEGSAVGLRGIDLEVMPGEIVGVAGVSGNGQRELGDVVLGLEKAVKGTKSLRGEDASAWPVGRIRDSGVAFVPENPLGMATIAWMSVLENMALGQVNKYSRQGGLALDWQLARQDMDRSFASLGLSRPPAGIPVRALSGGNVQRLTLAREFGRSPTLIIALYPSRGLDVPSTAAAQRLLVSARDAGAGVLLISEDLGELFALSDRLVVMYRGRIVGQFRPQETSAAEVGYLMTGSEVPHGAAA